MRVTPSALKHGSAEEDILYAASHPVFVSEPDEDSPARQFALGFDTHGRLLEFALLSFDSGNRLVIHAMRARQKYFKLL
ncbi:MAG: hypothetical protein Q4D79_14395, partial [Propionibacteriaceae bacterium]|nr:hypothetical protein [Propionibacteriaceae bacterium]